MAEPTLESLIEDAWERDPEFGQHVPRLRDELAVLRAKAAAWDHLLMSLRLAAREDPKGKVERMVRKKREMLARAESEVERAEDLICDAICLIGRLGEAKSEDKDTGDG